MAHSEDFTRIFVGGKGAYKVLGGGYYLTSDGERYALAGSNDGLSIWEIARCLGVNNRDLGYLCADLGNHINIFAKYKPVAGIPTPGIITEAQRKAKNYGMPYIPYFQVDPDDTTMDTPLKTFRAMAAAIKYNTSTYWSKAANYESGKTPWQYVKVEADSANNEWARILDFDGYYNNAAKLFTANCIKARKDHYAPDDTLVLDGNMGEYDQKALRATDIRPVKDGSILSGYEGITDLYLGLMFYAPDASPMGQATYKAAVFDSDPFPPLSISGENFIASDGRVQVVVADTVAFLSNAPVSVGQDGAVSTNATLFIPIMPSKSRTTVNVDAWVANFAWQDTVMPWVISGNDITFRMEVLPNGTFFYSFNTFAVYLNYGSSEQTTWFSLNMDNLSAEVRRMFTIPHELVAQGDVAFINLTVHFEYGLSTITIDLIDHEEQIIHSIYLNNQQYTHGSIDDTRFNETRTVAAATLWWGKDLGNLPLNQQIIAPPIYNS